MDFAPNHIAVHLHLFLHNASILCIPLRLGSLRNFLKCVTSWWFLTLHPCESIKSLTTSRLKRGSSSAIVVCLRKCTCKCELQVRTGHFAQWRFFFLGGWGVEGLFFATLTIGTLYKSETWDIELTFRDQGVLSCFLKCFTATQ